MATYDDYKEFIYEHGYNSNYWNRKTLKEYIEKFTIEETKLYKRKLHNLLCKRNRIRKHLKEWKNIYFITLTINDKKINNNKITYERKIKEIFKKHNYIANEDYGKTTKRLHYHVLTEDDIDLTNWKYGYTSKFKCRTSIEDNKRLSSYLTKLSNHGIKKGAGKLIYGRKPKKKKENQKMD